MAELTDDEVFGAPPPKEMSDTEVFGTDHKEPGFFGRLANNYNAAVNEGIGGMSEGAARAVAPDASAWERTKGAGEAAMGALGYVSSPINAASKTIVGDPTKNAVRMTGAPEGVAQFVGDTADIGSQLIGGGAITKAVPVIARGVTALEDATKLAPKEIPPTPKQVYQGAKDAFAVVDNSGVRVSPEPFQHFADQLGGNLKGYNPKLPSRAPETAKTLNELKNYASEEDTLKFSELADLKSNITGSISATGTNANDKRLLSQIGDHLDGFIKNLKEDHLDVGDANDITTVQSALDTAKDLWHKNAKMADISEIMKTAAVKKYPDRYIQQKFNAITSSPRKMKKYTADEQKIITDVANGGKLDTVAKWLAPSGDRVGFLKGALGSGIGAAAGTAAFGLPGVVGAVAVPAVGVGAKAISEAARRGSVQALQNTIALGHRPLTTLDRWRAARAAGRAGFTP